MQLSDGLEGIAQFLDDLADAFLSSEAMARLRNRWPAGSTACLRTPGCLFSLCCVAPCAALPGLSLTTYAAHRAALACSLLPPAGPGPSPCRPCSASA